MRKKVKSLISDAENSRARVEAIFRFVSGDYLVDSTGYVMRPRHSTMRNLYKKKIGMPFELILLLVEMLRASGLDAWPVLIATRDRLSFRLSGKFNHMLTLVDIDGAGVFLDASAKGCEPGFLPPLCLPGEGVLVDYDSSKPCLVAAELCETLTEQE